MRQESFILVRVQRRYLLVRRELESMTDVRINDGESDCLKNFSSDVRGTGEGT